VRRNSCSKLAQARQGPFAILWTSRLMVTGSHAVGLFLLNPTYVERGLIYFPANRAPHIYGERTPADKTRIMMQCANLESANYVGT
jgi:hypothetical protein